MSPNPDYLERLLAGCVVSDRGGESTIVERLRMDHETQTLHFRTNGDDEHVPCHRLPLVQGDDNGWSDGDRWTFYLPEDALDWEFHELVEALGKLREIGALSSAS